MAEMIVQIYDIYTPEQLDELISAGVDHIGIPVVSHGGTSPELAQEIINKIRGQAKSVVLSLLTDPDEAIKLGKYLKPDILQLQAPIEDLSVEVVKKIKAGLGSTKVMVAVPVTDEKSILLAKKFAEVADYILLDSIHEGQYGVTGKTHDWSISQKIVEEVGIPVILAGGLGPDNIAEAIKQVHPWGVDSKTKTDGPDGKLKDLQKVREFVDIAKRA